MDPALWELYQTGGPDDEVRVVLRLSEDGVIPPNVRVVSRFGEWITARIRRGDAPEVWGSDNVESLKAPRPVFCPDDPVDEMATEEPESRLFGVSNDPASHLNPEPSADATGRGVVVGFCDWGFDFTHPNFRHEDGSTRLLALWDQRIGDGRNVPEPYGYGRVFVPAEINLALTSTDPFAALGYDLASADPADAGCHGTHVADIAVGNRREPGSEVGLARESEIVFVHLGQRPERELANLGDSVELLEGLDFLRRVAGNRPYVMHLSAGKTGGPHRGSTAIERAIDFLLLNAGAILVQSVGNYADAAMHTHTRVGPNRTHSVDWLIPLRDRTPNELEFWYNGHDVFEVTLTSPNGQSFSVPLDTRLALGDATQRWGNLYHRRHEPNSGLNHIGIYLYPAAPGGRWNVSLRGIQVVDGRIHGWIERDARGRYQSRFPRNRATASYTTNTICNSYCAIAVGAYNAHQLERPITNFSSQGPTADGRQKPELCAPGSRIKAARSRPRNGWDGEPKLCTKSGTSMAAPWVTGTVALMLSAAHRRLTIHEVRSLLIGTADPPTDPRRQHANSLGYGYLNIPAAVDAARRLGNGTGDIAAAIDAACQQSRSNNQPVQPRLEPTGTIRSDAPGLSPHENGEPRANWESAALAAIEGWDVLASEQRIRRERLNAAPEWLPTDEHP